MKGMGVSGRQRDGSIWDGKMSGMEGAGVCLLNKEVYEKLEFFLAPKVTFWFQERIVAPWWSICIAFRRPKILLLKSTVKKVIVKKVKSPF